MMIDNLTPELPVPNVRAAQEYYRDTFGCSIAWYNEAGRIGAVSWGDSAVFFRETVGHITPVTHWVFSETLDEVYSQLKNKLANLDESLEEKPWGLRQFTVCDQDGHRLIFFHDV